MTVLNPYVALALAFGIGLMLGIERGWSLRDVADGGRVAGVRTYAVLGITGGIIGLLSDGPLRWIAAAAMLGIVAVLVLGYRTRLAAAPTQISATGELVALLTLLLGAMATTGYANAAVVIAGSVTFLLSMREQLHGWVKSLDQADIKAAAQYAVIACVILPVLPNDDFGPYNAWNPRNLWLVVVFVTGISFVGYWAGKRLGATRGTVVAAAIGATYSSTAVSAELARWLRKTDENASVLRAGIAAATAVMPLRVLVLVAILVPAALGSTAIGLAAAVVFTSGYALWAASRSSASGAPMPTRNPFDFWPAVGFAALIAVVIVVSHWSVARFGSNGLTVLMALTGLYDVDAAIILARNVPVGSLPARDLGRLLVLAVTVNTLWKATLVVALGGWRQGLRAALPLFGAAALLGGGMLVLG